MKDTRSARKTAPERDAADGKPRAERAIVLVPVLRGRPGAGGEGGAADGKGHSPENRLAEAEGLARAIDLDVRRALLVPLARPRPATLFGSGKVEELGALARDEEAALAVIDHAVSPVQQRNLEKAWNIKVLDRTGLILEIFGARARTNEGRLQVELAHLSYQKSRLVRSWTHLERQRGGRGFLGGPGEAQIELDRRMIDERIVAIRRELEAVVRTRALHRAGRRRMPYPVVAIVGYTNAGKSTLFNRLTGAAVRAEDQVFATLDPTMREVKLPSGRRIILSDTVGFISDLPTQLVAAFRATLEEVIEADLILHVRDIAHPETDAQARDVEGVLGSLDIDTAAAENHILEVWNKIDLLDPAARAEAEGAARWKEKAPVPVSAAAGDGIGALLAALDARLGGADEIVTLAVSPDDGRLLHWLHENAEVLDRAPGENGALVCRVRVDAARRGRLESLLRTRNIGLGSAAAPKAR